MTTGLLASSRIEPYFSTEGAMPSRGRLLLVSWNFPPALTAGSLRWQKMAHIAAERGWAFDVVTVDPARHGQRDPLSLEQLAPGTRVFTVDAPSLLMARVEHAAWRVFRSVRALRTVVRKDGASPAGASTSDGAASGAKPPSRPGSFKSESVRWLPREPRDVLRAYFAWQFTAQEEAWAEAAAKLAMGLVRDNAYEAVITSGPPHMSHVAGYLVSRETGLGHVMDMRDPWSLSERLLEPFASRLWLALADRAERRVINNATLVVANTEAARRGLAQRYPHLTDRMITVMNGYDGAAPPRVATARFTATYAGSIYLDRDPSPLFRAAARTIAELGLGPDDFALEFIGEVASYDGVSLETLAERAGVGAFVHRHAPLPRRELAARLVSAAMLVSLPQDSTMAIPSKVFEYMPYAAWLLALADRGTATELLLRDTAADVVSPDDEDGLARVLTQRVREHRAGVVPPPVARASFSRRAQTEQFLDALDRIQVGARPAD